MQNVFTARTAWIAIGLAMMAGIATAQQDAAPPSIKPGPEHKVFQRMAGTWDATVTMHGAPSSKGVETDPRRSNFRKAT